MPSRPRPIPPAKPPASSGGRTTPRGKRGPLPSTTAIATPKALDTINAFAFAWSDTQDTPLNTRLTAATQGSPGFGDGGANPDNTKWFRRRLIRSLQDVAASSGIPFACIAVPENPPCGGPGLHFHVHLHGPTNDADHAAFRAELDQALHACFQWQSLRAPGDYDPLEIKPERLGFLSACATFGYDLKGSEETFCLAVRRAGLECPFHRPHFGVTPQGKIYGKRVYISDSLQAHQRREAGFTDRSTLADPFPFVRDWYERLRARIRDWYERRRAASGAPIVAPARPASDGQTPRP